MLGEHREREMRVPCREVVMQRSGEVEYVTLDAVDLRVFQQATAALQRDVAVAAKRRRIVDDDGARS